MEHAVFEGTGKPQLWISASNSVCTFEALEKDVDWINIGDLSKATAMTVIEHLRAIKKDWEEKEKGRRGKDGGGKKERRKKRMERDMKGKKKEGRARGVEVGGKRVLVDQKH